MMIGIDDYEVCRRMQNIQSLKEIPVIFLTAKADSDSMLLQCDKALCKAKENGRNKVVSL